MENHSPAGMNWTWKDNKSPSTAEAGVFKYKSIATYKDGSSSEDKNSGSDGTVTLNVKPKQPIITPNLEHKKRLTKSTNYCKCWKRSTEQF